MRLLGSIGAGAVLLAGIARIGVVPSLFSANYLPHRFCYLAQPGLVWTNVATDSLIALSYGLLFGCLLSMAVRLRKVAAVRGYLWIFLSFGIFILACGLTHVMEVVTVWMPLYPLSAGFKVLCALASVPTAVMFAWATPALAGEIPRVMDSLTKTQVERDEARAALLASEQILAERQRAEAEIAAANARMNRILDSTSDGIMKVASDWTISYGNRYVRERIAGFRPGASFWDVFPSDGSADATVLLRRTMEDGEPCEFETYYAPTDDWFHVCGYRIEGGISLFGRSVTAEKRLEQTLETERAQSLRQLHSVMDSTSEGILKIGQDWTILYGNRVAFEILPDLALGKNYWVCFPGLEGSDTERHLRRTMEQRQKGEWENFYERYGEWYAVHAYPTDGGVSIFFVPITQRKQLEQQLEQERMLREQRIETLSHLAGGLAHEISNPLAIIHGTASDLRRMAGGEEPLDGMELRKATESILNTADRASRILRGLRGFAHEGSKDPMEYASLYDIVEGAVEMQASRFARHGVALRVELEADLPPVVCRETQIGQIVTNLLNNSHDAITQHDCRERWVRLEASCMGHEVQIDVIDSGLGIDEASRAQLMKPFFTTKSKGLGMGIGLSLSRAIAQEHGGSLELLEGVENTCFRLRLPARTAAEDMVLLETGAVHAAE